MKKTIINILTIIGAITICFGSLQLIALTPIWPFPLFEWEYEELSRVESPDGQFEIVPFRGNAGVVSGYTYDLFVVRKGYYIDRENSPSRVFTAYEDTQLLNYRWQGKTVEIEVGDGPIGYYKTFYSSLAKKEGDVVLKVK